MAGQDEIAPGGVMIDLITLENTIRALEHGGGGTLFFLSLANFVETLVLHETIYVDKHSLEKSDLQRFSDLKSQLASLDKSLVSLVSAFDTSGITRRNAYKFACAVADSIEASKLFLMAHDKYPEFTIGLGVSSGYWRAETAGPTPYAREDTNDPLAKQWEDQFYEAAKSELTIRRYFPYDESIPFGQESALIDCAFRAWFYLGLSMQKRIMYVPNDFRAIFIAPILQSQTTSTRIMAKLELLFADTISTNATWLHEQYPSESLRVPLIFNYIVSRASSLKEVIPIALELRDGKPASQFRKLCRELDEAREHGKVRTISRIVKALDSELGSIANLEQTSPNFEITLSFPPSLTFDLSTLTNLVKKTHVVFLRQVFDGSRDPRVVRKSLSALFQRERH